MASIEKKLEYLEETKEQIRKTINEKGGDCPPEMPFRDYIDEIYKLRNNHNFVLAGSFQQGEEYWTEIED